LTECSFIFRVIHIQVHVVINP